MKITSQLLPNPPRIVLKGEKLNHYCLWTPTVEKWDSYLKSILDLWMEISVQLAHAALPIEHIVFIESLVLILH